MIRCASVSSFTGEAKVVLLTDLGCAIPNAEIKHNNIEKTFSTTIL
jgi:hypothetical protein